MKKTLEDIMTLVFQITHCDFYKKSLKELLPTSKEYVFLDAIIPSHFYINLNVEKSVSRQTVLTWYSDINQNVAWYLNDERFTFSNIRLYTPSTRRMEGFVHKTFPIDSPEAKIIEKEINALKDLFTILAPDIEKYFN